MQRHFSFQPVSLMYRSCKLPSNSPEWLLATEEAADFCYIRA